MTCIYFIKPSQIFKKATHIIVNQYCQRCITEFLNNCLLSIIIVQLNSGLYLPYLLLSVQEGVDTVVVTVDPDPGEMREEPVCG